MVSSDIAIRNVPVLSDCLTGHYPACVGDQCWKCVVSVARPKDSDIHLPSGYLTEPSVSVCEWFVSDNGAVR